MKNNKDLDRALSKFLKENAPVAPEPSPYEEQRIKAHLDGRPHTWKGLFRWKWFVPATSIVAAVLFGLFIKFGNETHAPTQYADLNVVLEQAFDEPLEEYGYDVGKEWLVLLSQLNSEIRDQ
jgi:anti-sigma-K factor RskA